jgi:hypothetical protein
MKRKTATGSAKEEQTTRRIRFDSIHEQPSVIVPLDSVAPSGRDADGQYIFEGRTVTFASGETKELDAADAMRILGNPNFVDVDDEDRNRNFMCSVCGTSTLAAAGFPTPQNRIVWYRDSDGRPLCVEDFLKANPAWRLWHDVAFARGGERPSKRRIAQAIAEAAKVEPAAQLEAPDDATVQKIAQLDVIPFMNNSPVKVAYESMLVEDKAGAWKNLHTPRPPTYGDPAGTQVGIGGLASSLTLEQQQSSAAIVLSLDDDHAQTCVYLMTKWMAHNEGRTVPQRVRAGSAAADVSP